MVTTSGNLVAGEAINGRGGDGNGRSGLKAKLALGVALLGCAGALAFGGLRATSEAPSQAATGAGAASSTYRVWAGTCRAGGSDCLPGDDDTAPGVARTMPRAWTGTCRAGGSDCLPDEDLAFQTEQRTSQFAPVVNAREDGRFLEQNLDLPGAGAGLLVTATPHLDWATIRFLEQNLDLALAPADGPGIDMAIEGSTGLREYLDGEAAAMGANVPDLAMPPSLQHISI